MARYSERALYCLQETLAEAVALDLPGEVWQAEVALARLLRQCGRDEAAVQAHARAHAILQMLAGGIGSDELRTRFLAAAPVRRVLEE